MYISNLIASIDDDRDYIYTPKTTVPRAASLRNWIGGIEDQGKIGSCTANAVVSAVEIICQRAEKHRDLSRLFNYYGSRKRDNLLGQEGAMLRSACKAAVNDGLPLESLYPYLPDIRDQEPPASVYTEAAKTRVTRYERIVIDRTKDGFNVWHAMKSAISEGHPVVVAMFLSSQFPKLKGKNYVEQNYLGCMNQMPPAPYSYIGNHAMVVTGYDGDQVEMENSWGTEFGDQGMAYIAATTFDRDVYEAWVIKSFDDIQPGPAITYVNSPQAVLEWYRQVWRHDVTSQYDEGVQYWAQHPGGKNAFLQHWKYLVQLKCDELMVN